MINEYLFYITIGIYIAYAAFFAFTAYRNRDLKLVRTVFWLNKEKIKYLVKNDISVDYRYKKGYELIKTHIKENQKKIILPILLLGFLAMLIFGICIFGLVYDDNDTVFNWRIWTPFLISSISLLFMPAGMFYTMDFYFRIFEKKFSNIKVGNKNLIPSDLKVLDTPIKSNVLIIGKWTGYSLNINSLERLFNQNSLDVIYFTAVECENFGSKNNKKIGEYKSLYLKIHELQDKYN